MTATIATNPAETEAIASVAAPPAIEAKSLGFHYGDREALSDVSFSIARGEIFGFLGPNGGGKTTLFKLLSTLVPIQSGAAKMLGHDLAGETIRVRRRIGVVFQHPSLDGKLTVAENLAHHGHLYGMTGKRLRDRSAAMLKRLGLTARARDLVETLSGGLQRRVELAKALLHEPELLLLDEPSTGLDPAARREFSNYLAHLREHDGVTVVLTTHYMEEAERCDRVGILHQGKLVAFAPPGNLKAEVGGDVVVIHARAPELLQRKILQRFRLKGQIVDATIRIERPRGQEFVHEVVDAFGDEIDSISFGKPTLEDVFVHLTGHQFFTDARNEGE
ncbi:MAG: ATP-binding cassette domain-containing protein [Candidatus Binatus sp.]|uniref:ATP-binding cassette domain-containing protein n=1 Tax=Candidatus Binatus sp. TaxID=2811406 RepID=UPI002724C966|nr:ATP-binding cassette domain-containing protein [Candidatus Binatus sp.]MDO8431060.1 ATP-binding cassette domain-containing protein [Candidatus Binatus sp.]